MKKIILVLTLISTMVHAQTVQSTQPIPQIAVTGEGKIKITPDEAIITVGIENLGKDATEVKKTNDNTVDLVLKSIKKNGISASDIQTQHVTLNKNYDYQTKKYNYKHLKPFPFI